MTITLRSETPGLEFAVMSDSGVYREGLGYERVLIVKGWHRDNPDWLAQVFIRVDRSPTDSIAEASVWLPSGWEPVHATNPNDWWRSMQGYLRWLNDQSERDTRRLAAEIVTRLRTLDLY